MDRTPPPGFVVQRSSAFLDRIGPLYVSSDDPSVFGAYVADEHLNTMGGAHGGYLAALVDIVTGRGTRSVLADGKARRTVSMTIDYVSGAALADWLTLRVVVDRAGGRTVFVSCRISSGDTLVARASVILTG